MGNNSNRANTYRESLSQGSSSISSNNSNRGRASAYRESIGAKTSGIDYRKSQADKLKRERIENAYTVPTKANGPYYNLDSMTDDEVKAEYNSLNPGNFFERFAKDKMPQFVENTKTSSNPLEKWGKDLKTFYSLDDNEDYKRKQELSGRYRSIVNEETRQKMLDAGMTDELFMAMNQPNNPLNMEAQSKYEEIVNSGVVNSTDAMNMMLDSYTREATIENTKNDYVGSNVNAILANPMESTINIGKTAYDYMVGNPISGYENYADVVRNQTREDIDSDAGRFWYDQGISIADEGYSMLIGRLANNANVGNAIQGIEKGSSTINEGVERGLNPSKIVASGISSAVTTAITESFSHGKLDDLAEVGKHGFQGKTAKEIGSIVAKTMVGSSSTEALQEVEEELADYLSDVLINGDQNKFATDYRNYVASGMSKEEAISTIIGNSLKELGSDAVGGAIGGILFGGAGTTFNYATGNTQEAYEDRLVADRLKQTGNIAKVEETVKAMDKNTDAYKAYAEAIRGTKNGTLEEATNADIKAVYEAVTKQTEQNVSNSIKADETELIKSELNKRGITDSATVEAVTKYIESKQTGKSVKINESLLTDENVADFIVDYIGGNIKAEESQNTKALREAQNEMYNVFDKNLDGIEKIAEVDGKYVVTKADGSRETISKNELSMADNYNLKEATKLTPSQQKVYFETNSQYSAETFRDAYNIAYEAGKAVADTDVLFSDNSLVKVLTEKGISQAYNEGVMSASANAKASEENLKKALADWNGKLKGASFNADGIDYKKLNSSKKTLYNIAQGFAKMGINVELIDDASADAENGWFTTNGNKIVINLSARYTKQFDAKGAKYVVNTMSHELTHYLEFNASESYKALENAIINYFKSVKDGEVSKYDTLLQKFLDRGLTEAEAKSEVIARACEDVLTNNKEMTEILSHMDGSVLDEVRKSILGFFENIRSFIRTLMGNSKSNAQEAELLRSIDGALNDVTKKWAEAFTIAIGKANQYTETLEETGIGYSEESGTVAKNSVRYTLAEVYEELGYKSYKECVEEIAKDISIKSGINDVEKVKKWIEAEESIASIILDEANREYLDYMPDKNFDAIKKNSDYKQGTVDFSNLCRKREIFTKMFDSLQKKYPDKLFNADDIAKIREILKEEDYEVACALCYVEDRRQKMGEIAQNFIGFYNDALNSDSKRIFKRNDSGKRTALYPTKAQMAKYGLKYSQFKATDKYVPTQYDLVTYEGFSKLKQKHPMIAYAFERYNNSRGMASARLIEGHAEYEREILDYTPDWIKKINDMGGLRAFSFSDFEAIHLIDMCQVIVDCARMGVKMQTYTKVPEFAKLVANTGIKLNRSLIPANKGSKHAYARVMENGVQKFVKVEPYKDGIAKLNGKDVLAFDNVEGIDVTSEYFFDSTDNNNIGNILIGMSDEQIRLAMADPFVDYIIPFHTGQRKSVLHTKGIDGWYNYKDVQLDKKLPGSTSKNKYINIYTDVLAKYNPKNTKEFQEAFLKECKVQKFTPRFEEFTKGENSDGYYKLLLDFKLFDKNGNLAEQTTIVPDIDTALATKILEEGRSREEQIKFSKSIMKRVEKEVVLKSTKEDADGNTLTDAQVEYFKESKVRDGNGRLIPMYHGSKEYGFTIFDSKYSDDKRSLFFTDNIEVADSYRGQKRKGDTYKVYLNLANPLIIDAKGKYWSKIASEEVNNVNVDPIKYGNFMFINQADYDEFVEKYPIEKLRKQADEMSRDDEITIDDETYDYFEFLDYIDDLNYEAVKEYRKYHYNYTTPITAREFFDNYEKYNWFDLADVILSFDSNGLSYIDLIDTYEDDGYEDAVEDTKSMYEEYDQDIEDESDSAFNFTVHVMPTSGTYDKTEHNNTRGWSKKAYEEGYDGVIFKNVSDTHNEGYKLSTVAVAFNSNQIKLTTNENPTENEDIRYSSKVGIENEIKDWYNNQVYEAKAKKIPLSEYLKTSQGFFNIGTTSQPFQLIGLSEKEMRFGRAKIGTILDAHDEMTIDIISKIPEALDNPIVIMRSKTHPKDSIVAICDIPLVKNKNNARAIVAIKISSNGVEIDDYVLTTAYGRDGNEIKNLFSDKDAQFYYINPDKNKTTATLSALQVQFPSSTMGYGLIKKIPPSMLGVKPNKLNSEKVDDPSADILGQTSRLEEENAKLKAQFNEVKSRLVSKEAIKTLTDKILQDTNSSYKKADLLRELNNLYSNIDGMTYEEMMNSISQIASNVLAEAKIKRADDYAKHILRDLRNTRIHLTEAEINSLKEKYGDDYRNLFMGKVILTKNDGLSLAELVNKYPSMFPNVTEPGEFLERYYDIYATANAYEDYYNTQLVRDTALDIYSKLFNAKQIVKPYADSMLKDKEMYTKSLANMRKQRDESLSKLRQNAKARKESEMLNRERNKLIGKISAKCEKLMKLMNEDSAKHHVINELKMPVLNLLDSIEFASNRYLNTLVMTKKDKSIARQLSSIKDIVQDVVNRQEKGDFTIDIPSDMLDTLDLIEDSLKVLEEETNGASRQDSTLVLRELNLEALQGLDRIVTAMDQVVRNANKLLASRNAHSADVPAKKIVEYAKKLGTRKYNDTMLERFFTSDMTTPYYFFSHLGDGGREIFGEMMDGWDKFAFNVKTIQDFSKNTFNEKEVAKWRKQTKTIDVYEELTAKDIADGKVAKIKKVDMTIAQIMSLYCLAKREQALGHILKDGISINGIQDKLGRTNATQRVTITEQMLDAITSELTEEQKNVADKIQEFMNTVCSDWGNEISYKRFGIYAFTEANYFPITVDNNVLGADSKEQNESSIYKLLNLSFTKALTKNASNRITIGDIFSTFVAHSSDMAKYNSLALPVLDMIKVLNYKEVGATEGTQREVMTIRDVIDDAYGSKATKYIRQFLVDLNGTQRVDDPGIVKKLIRNYKASAVGANLQVALLQPLSYIRASYVINPKYLSMAFARKLNINEPKTKCGISCWKSFGNFDTNISTGLEHQILGDDTIKDKIVEKSMKLAELGDDVTWSYIYNACYFEVKDKKPNLSGDEFDQAVADRFREVVYSTQVVDSTMTRSQMMRKKGVGWQSMTAFMSEPTIAYNMCMDGYVEFSQEYRRTKNLSQALSKSGKKIALATACYSIGALAESALRGLISAVRNPLDDDDDDDTILARIIEQFKNEINPGGKIPLIKDMIETFEGNTVAKTEYDFALKLRYAITGFNKNGFNYKSVYRLVQSISEFSGVPMAGLMREVSAIWNNTIGRMYDDLQMK